MEQAPQRYFLPYTLGKKVKTKIDFTKRLSEFNKRMKSLVDSNLDYEKWMNEFYPKNAPDWISKGKIQMDSYQWMAKRLKHLHYYVHLEDVDFLRNTWSI